ncbi:MAG: DUF2971 domain-containing protein [Gemmatimonadaceae bacterium]
MRAHDREYFYKYTNAHVAALILENRSIRWSSPVHFNDAFDVGRVIDFGYDADELMVAVRHGMADIIEAGAEDPPFAYETVRELLASTRQFAAEGRLSLARSAALLRDDVGVSAALPFTYYQEQWDLFVPRFRILCLTTVPDSPQMWAYYGEELRGVVFEFEALDAFANPLLEMRAVTYQDDPPHLATKDEFARHMLGLIQLDLGELFAEYEYTKARNWQHESEWRLVNIAADDDSETYGDVAFDPRLLRRVIFGTHCADADRRSILERLSAPHYRDVSLATVRPDYAHRRFEIDPIERSPG